MFKGMVTQISYNLRHQTGVSQRENNYIITLKKKCYFQIQEYKRKKKIRDDSSIDDFLLSRLHKPTCADTNSNPPA